MVTLDIPPLRDRREDIPLLANYFLEKYAKEKGKTLHGFDPKAMRALMNYDWSENNIRELENEIERTVIFTKGRTTIQLSHLSEKLRNALPGRTRVSGDFFTDDTEVPLTFEEFERKYIRFILERTGGNKAKAAHIMNIPRSTLRGKMRRLGLSE